MKKGLIAAGVAGVLLVGASCALIEELRYVSAEVAGRAVALECALSLEERRKNLVAINGWMAAQGLTSRATAFDCNGDGSPDF